MSSGILLIDKPEGVTSFDVVSQLRHTLQTKKVGHAGTLDPFASGLLVCAYGSATRLLPYITHQYKTYDTTIRLGTSSSTDDCDGDIYPQSLLIRQKMEDLLRTLPPSDIDTPSQKMWCDVEEIVNTYFMGPIAQTPSKYSAVRINGKHAYELARAGEEVDIAPRSVIISSFNITKCKIIANENGIFCDIDARITCSAGTYIRALGRDIGERMGLKAYLTSLRRIAIGDFSVAGSLGARAACVKKIIKNGDTKVLSRIYWQDNNVRSYILSPAYVARTSMPWWDITQEERDNLRYGKKIILSSSQRHHIYEHERCERKTREGEVYRHQIIPSNESLSQKNPSMDMEAAIFCSSLSCEQEHKNEHEYEFQEAGSQISPSFSKTPPEHLISLVRASQIGKDLWELKPKVVFND